MIGLLLLWQNYFKFLLWIKVSNFWRFILLYQTLIHLFLAEFGLLDSSKVSSCMVLKNFTLLWIRMKKRLWKFTLHKKVKFFVEKGYIIIIILFWGVHAQSFSFFVLRSGWCSIFMTWSSFEKRFIQNRVFINKFISLAEWRDCGSFQSEIRVCIF